MSQHSAWYEQEKNMVCAKKMWHVQEKNMVCARKNMVCARKCMVCARKNMVCARENVVCAREKRILLNFLSFITQIMRHISLLVLFLYVVQLYCNNTQCSREFNGSQGSSDISCQLLPSINGVNSRVLMSGHINDG